MQYACYPDFDYPGLLKGVLARLPGATLEEQLAAAAVYTPLSAYAAGLLAIQANRLRPPAERFRPPPIDPERFHRAERVADRRAEREAREDRLEHLDHRPAHAARPARYTVDYDPDERGMTVAMAVADDDPQQPAYDDDEEGEDALRWQRRKGRRDRYASA